MPVFIRYPFFGFVILALSACGSSGSAKLLGQNGASDTENNNGATSTHESYPTVEYLITDISGAIEKFASDTSAGTSAIALTSTPAALDTLRSRIIAASSRYLSTGTVLAWTDEGTVVDERPHSDPDADSNPAATCEDKSATGAAKCVFGMDSLREETTVHLGPESGKGVTQVSFQTFRADREPVMLYRQTLMSQIRTVPSQDKEVYEDADGNEYLLTRDNVANMELTDETVLPLGITLDTAPDFSSLSKVSDSQGKEDYVGYDGILEHSMFFVGVHRFFDEEDVLQHERFEHASFGRIYDEDAVESGIQSPGIVLTGEGVMVGMEREKSTLDSHLVQGDVNIMYNPASAADNTVNPPVVAMDAMVEISIANIQRLDDDDDAWYAQSSRLGRLSWTLSVTDSKFSSTPTDDDPGTEDQGRLSGSFYGTEDDPEVGGVFHHEDTLYEIIGSFGSKLGPEGGGG